MDLNDFPKEFLWGTSTAAHQVDGSNLNNDWWGGKYAEDFDRAQSLGTNAQRLSIEWSGLEPRENEWDEHAIAYYRKVRVQRICND